jgi:hypothetical protein
VHKSEGLVEGAAQPAPPTPQLARRGDALRTPAPDVGGALTGLVRLGSPLGHRDQPPKEPETDEPDREPDEPRQCVSDQIPRGGDQSDEHPGFGHCPRQGQPPSDTRIGGFGPIAELARRTRRAMDGDRGWVVRIVGILGVIRGPAAAELAAHTAALRTSQQPVQWVHRLSDPTGVRSASKAPTPAPSAKRRVLPR